MRILVYIILAVVYAIAFILLASAWDSLGEHPGALIGVVIMIAGVIQSARGLIVLVRHATRDRHK